MNNARDLSQAHDPRSAYNCAAPATSPALAVTDGGGLNAPGSVYLLLPKEHPYI